MKKTYDLDKITFGVELEIADWDRTIEIPRELGVIDKNDISICNSNGVGVNPYIEGGFGGEINTTPCSSVIDQAGIVTKIFKTLKLYHFNHSCWMHIHVGLPFDFSLDELKEMLVKVHKANKWIPLTNVCPVKKVDDKFDIIDDNYIESVIRRNLTRQSCMTDEEYEGAMNAKTEDEFWKYFERKRHVVNMQSLRYHKTLEFRCFYMSDNYEEILTSLEFCEQFVYNLLTDKTEIHMYKTFPKATTIDLNMEEMYKKTIVEKRKKINNFTGEDWK